MSNGSTSERPGTRALEYIFLASAPVPLFILLGFLLEGSIEGVLPDSLGVSLNTLYLCLMGLLYLATWWSLRTYQRGHPTFLIAPSGCSAAEVAAPFLGWSLVAYLVPGVLIGATTLMLVDRTDNHWDMIVFVFAAYFPVFFAVPLGAVVAWQRVAANNQHAG